MKNGLALTAVFGTVGYLLSYGIFIPREFSFFQLLAAVGMMVGYPAGQISSGVGTSPAIKISLLIGSGLICVGTAIAYVIMIQMGSANTSDVVILALLIAVFFFSFAFLMPFAGVILDSSGAQTPG